MIASPPRLAADLHPTETGWQVIPKVLPIYVPREALTMTVREWLDLPEDEP